MCESWLLRFFWQFQTNLCIDWIAAIRCFHIYIFKGIRIFPFYNWGSQILLRVSSTNACVNSCANGITFFILLRAFLYSLSLSWLFVARKVFLFNRFSVPIFYYIVFAKRILFPFFILKNFYFSCFFIYFCNYSFDFIANFIGFSCSFSRCTHKVSVKLKIVILYICKS